MASAIHLTAAVLLIVSTVYAIPLEDGGIDRFSKVQSFSSSMSDINGQRQEDSESSDEAFINGVPVYILNGERQYDTDEGEHEVLDVIDPEENSRFHLDNLNGDAIGYQEPLEEPLEESDEDYYQDEDLEGPSGNLDGPISDWLDDLEDEDLEDYVVPNNNLVPDYVNDDVV